MRACDLTEPFEEARKRRDDAHVTRDWLDDDRGDLVAARAEERPERVEVVERRAQGERSQRRGDAARVRDREGRPARSGLHQQAVGVAVVAAVELDQERTARRAAGHANRAHRGLRPRADQTDELDGRIGRGDRLRHLDLERRRRPVARATARGLTDRLDHRRRRVSQDERSPRAEEVQVRAPVHVPDPRPLAPRDEERFATDAPEGAHRAIHTPGDEPGRRLEQPLRIAHGSDSSGTASRRTVHFDEVTGRVSPSECGTLGCASLPHGNDDICYAGPDRLSRWRRRGLIFVCR